MAEGSPAAEELPLRTQFSGLVARSKRRGGGSDDDPEGSLGPQAAGQTPASSNRRLFSDDHRPMSSTRCRNTSVFRISPRRVQDVKRVLKYHLLVPPVASKHREGRRPGFVVEELPEITQRRKRLMNSVPFDDGFSWPNRSLEPFNVAHGRSILIAVRPHDNPPACVPDSHKTTQLDFWNCVPHDVGATMLIQPPY
jgi:hypothetical protein